jgi:hypothetical protein
MSSSIIISVCVQDRIGQALTAIEKSLVTDDGLIKEINDMKCLSEHRRYSYVQLRTERRRYSFVR